MHVVARTATRSCDYCDRGQDDVSSEVLLWLRCHVVAGGFVAYNYDE